MANRGIHEFTVVEAANMSRFLSWHYEELDLNDPSRTFTKGGTINAGANTLAQVVNGPTIDLTVGMNVTGTNIPANTYLLTVNLNEETNKWSATMSANATGSGSQTPSITFNGGNDTESSSYITVANPAKKIIIYDKPGPSGGVMDEIDVLTLTIGAAGDRFYLTIDASDLPFILSGFMITSLMVRNDTPANQGAGDNAVSLLSFH